MTMSLNNPIEKSVVLESSVKPSLVSSAAKVWFDRTTTDPYDTNLFTSEGAKIVSGVQNAAVSLMMCSFENCRYSALPPNVNKYTKAEAYREFLSKLIIGWKVMSLPAVVQSWKGGE